MPEKNNNNRTGRYVGYAMLVLAAVLVVLVVFLVLNYRSLRRSAVISARESWLSAFVHNHGPLSVADVGYVRPWMTFDYLNKLFNLPPGYLKTQLMVQDPQYPQLTVSGYANRDHLNVTVLMGKIEDAIRAYFAAVPTSTTSTAI